MKIYKLLLIFIVLLSSLYGDDLKKVSLQLLWKHQFEFAGFYMAKEKGFYKDAGLDVDLKEYKLGTNITKDVLDGKSTFGIGYQSIILDKSNGADIVLLNAIFQSSPNVLVTLKSSGINSIKDFKNKKIMIEKDAIKTAPLLSMLYSKGISLDDIKIVQPTFHIEDLINKKVDISSAYLSNEIYQLDDKAIPYKIWNPSDYGFDFYNDILFTSNKFLTNHPKLVVKFQQASLRGWQYAFSHINETVDIILKKYNTQHKTKGALQYEAKVLKKLVYKDNIPFGDINKHKIQRIYDIYNLMGLAKHKIDLDKFVYKKNKEIVNLTQEEKQWIKNNTVRIGISPWYPITFYDKFTNKIDGVGYDIVNQVVQNLHLHVKYVPDTWHHLLSSFKDHKIDLLPTTYYTKQIATYGIYSKKYLNIKEQLYVKKSSKIKDFKDLNNKTIATVKAYGAIPKIKSKFPKIKIVEVATLEKGIQMLVNNQVDAIFNTQFGVDSYLKDHFIYNLKPLYQTAFKSSPLYFFTNNEKTILANILQKGLNSIDNTTKHAILSKWINTDTNNLKKLDLFTKKEKKYLQNKKVIKMCIDPDWMPFERIKDGKHIGMTADFFKIFEHNLGYEIKLISTKNWSQSLEFAKNRKCDILSLAMETPKRKKYMNFTSAYLKIPLVLATKNDKPFIGDFTSLGNKKVGIPKGYAFIELLKTKYPNLNIIEVKNIDDGLEKVTTGELYGYIGTLASVGYAFQNRFTGELKIAGKFDEKWKLGIAVRNDDLVLLDIFDKLIKSVNNAQSQKILNNWLSIKYEEHIDYKFLWEILLFVSIVILFFIYRQYTLKKSNQKLAQVVDEKTKDLKILNANLEVRIAKEVKKNLAIQEQLFNSERLAAMGEMIGNISHQWRQPLSVISTAATGMKMQKEYEILTDEMLISSCEAINDNAQYLSKTIDDFKNFIKGDRTKQTFNLKTAIDGFLNLMEGTIKTNHIDMILDIDDTLEINGYENELKQCLINIFNNAKDVLKKQEEQNRFLFITIKKETTNDYVTILLKDSGGGVPENIITKIFDPYFTTKHQSQGTGLGLNMAYKMITEGMKGTIAVHNIDYTYMNNNYTGAEFKITLPFS